MAKAKMVVTGIKEIDKKLKSLESRLARRHTARAMRAGMKEVQQEAIRNCPVDSGKLRSSIKIRAGKKSRREMRMNVQTGQHASAFKGETYYGGMVEWSTSKMPAKPFMRPAFDSKAETAKRITMDFLWDALKSEIRK